MNLAKIQFPVFNPYIKSAIEIYISGCFRRCVNCHNKELQDFNYGEFLEVEHVISYLKERQHLFSIISITGGDILCHPFFPAFEFVSNLKNVFSDKEFWLFTGAEITSIVSDWKKIFDKIKTGVYDERLRVEGFPASSNQRLLVKGVDY